MSLRGEVEVGCDRRDRDGVPLHPRIVLEEFGVSVSLEGDVSILPSGGWEDATFQAADDHWQLRLDDRDVSWRQRDAINDAVRTGSELRERYRFVCPGCGDDLPVRWENLAFLLGKVVLAGEPYVDLATLRGILDQI